MTVPYTFGNANGVVALAELDANFAAVGEYANTAGSASMANTAAIANFATTAGTSNFATTAGTSNFANVSGSTQLSATVSGNAQPNITSVGLLTSVTVTGNVTAGYLLGNGSQLTGISTTSDANALTGNILSANVVNSSLTSVGVLANLTVTGNVYSNGNIAMVSNLPRNTYVANVAPTSGQGNIGDIWYQTF
jgi:hypothetical protein